MSTSGQYSRDTEWSCAGVPRCELDSQLVSQTRCIWTSQAASEPTRSQSRTRPPEPTPTLPRHRARAAKDRRLLSNVRLMSSAASRGAVQEAEIRDENNPARLVQVRVLVSVFPRRPPGVAVFPDGVVHLAERRLRDGSPLPCVPRCGPRQWQAWNLRTATMLILRRDCSLS